MVRDRRNAPTLISLFTGAGGLDIGLEDAGFTTLVANELELHACETLRANQILPTLKGRAFAQWFEQQARQRCYEGDSEVIETLKRRLLLSRPRPYLEQTRVIQGDVRELASADLLDVSGLRRGDLCLLAGGPPCQPFSRAGKREAVQVADGRLFLEFVRLVRDLRPRWFLFENVKGLLLTKAEVVRGSCGPCRAERVVSFDERSGYLEGNRAPAPACPRCDAPLASLRTENIRGGSLEMIVEEFTRAGYRCDWRLVNAADFGAPQMRERLLLVGSRDGETIEWPRGEFGEESLAAADDQLTLFRPPRPARPWRTMFESLWPDGNHEQFGRLDRASAVLWVKNVVRPHDEPVTWKLDRPSPTIGAHQAAKLAIAPRGVPPAQLARQQWHVLGRRQGDTPPVKVVHSYLSDAELLRLQTFPATWYLYGTRMQRAFQIGNAVPPILAHAVGTSIFEASGFSARPAAKAARV